MEPIATYSEKRFSGKRKFQLFKEKLYIQGIISTRGDFELTLDLKDLNPDYSVMRLREKNWLAGLWMVLIPLFALPVLLSRYKMTIEDFPVVISVVMAVSGAIMILVMSKKVEFYRFSNSSDIVVLDVARSGSEKEKFDDFIEKLIACINESKTVR